MLRSNENFIVCSYIFRALSSLNNEWDVEKHVLVALQSN